MNQSCDFEIHGSLVMEVLICMQIAELKMMIADCSKKIDEIEILMEKLKEQRK